MGVYEKEGESPVSVSHNEPYIVAIGLQSVMGSSATTEKCHLGILELCSQTYVSCMHVGHG